MMSCNTSTFVTLDDSIRLTFSMPKNFWGCSLRHSVEFCDWMALFSTFTCHTSNRVKLIDNFWYRQILTVFISAWQQQPHVTQSSDIIHGCFVLFLWISLVMKLYTQKSVIAWQLRWHFASNTFNIDEKIQLYMLLAKVFCYGCMY